MIRMKSTFYNIKVKLSKKVNNLPKEKKKNILNLLFKKSSFYKKKSFQK